MARGKDMMRALYMHETGGDLGTTGNFLDVGVCECLADRAGHVAIR
jgi:hypothetical protein